MKFFTNLEYKMLEVVTEANDSTVSSGSVILYQGKSNFVSYLDLSLFPIFRIHQNAAKLRRDRNLKKIFEDSPYIHICFES